MNRLFVLCLLTTLVTMAATAQTAKVSISIAGPPDYTGTVVMYDPTERFNTPTMGHTIMALDGKQSATCIINGTVPHYVILSFNFPSGNTTRREKGILFISPGDDLNLTFNFDKKDNGIVATGKGSNNNQPEIVPLTEIYTAILAKDTVPSSAIATINKQQILNKKILDNYIIKYKPTADFVKNSRFNVAYYAPVNYLILKESGLRNIRNPQWQAIQDSLFATIKLNNDEALTAFNYFNFASELSLRLKEKAWVESNSNREAFYKEWYDTTPAEGKSIFSNERKNLFVEKVINKNFSGKTAEYLNAHLIKDNLLGNNIENVGLLFEHFKLRYPNSKYIQCFAGPVAMATNKQNQLLNDKMIFAANDGTQINTFKELLELNKGTTVLIDMWGTWCGPCREEIEQNSAILRDHFKEKGLTFMYVANMDMQREKYWKELIGYFHLEGDHVLANAELTGSIMNAVKSKGFPTYIIIKKDGSYALAKSQRPFNRPSMIPN